MDRRSYQPASPPHPATCQAPASLSISGVPRGHAIEEHMLEPQPTPNAPIGMAGMAASQPRWAGTIAALKPTEVHHVQWHLLRLEADCRRARFGNPASDGFSGLCCP